MKKLLDLSHAIEDGLVTYKGLPAPIICDYLSRNDNKRYEQMFVSHHLKSAVIQVVVFRVIVWRY